MSRRRNFSPWAYWSLHLQSTVVDDPFPEGADRAAFDAWRERVRMRLAELLGPAPTAVAADLETTEVVDCGDHTRARILYDTEPAMSVPAYLLVPKERVGAAPGPAVLAIHGHGPGKSLVCGVVDGPDPAVAEDYARSLARLGYVVLAPDLRCFGERQDPQWDPAGHKYDCDWNLVAATMAGVNPLAQNLWDLQRSLDVLADHPLVASDRIGAVGLSYGATMALFLAAADTRVRAAVVSGYLSSWASAHAVPWNMCGSQVMFGQLGRIEHADLAALIAPRALSVESGVDDPIFPVAAARTTMALLAPVWATVGAASDALRHTVFDGGHRWDGRDVEDFLAAHL